MLKLKDRLQLLKAGYSKKEIEALAEAEAQEEITKAEDLKDDVTSADDVVNEQETDNSTGADKYMEVINNLANEIKELKTNIYQNNINKTEVIGSNTLEQEADKILASLINPLNNKEEK